MNGDPDALVGVARSPGSVTPIVAGGAAGAFSSVVALWGGGGNSRSVTKEVRTALMGAPHLRKAWAQLNAPSG